MSPFDDWRRQLPNLSGSRPRNSDPEPVPRPSPKRPGLPGRVRDTPVVGRPVGTPYPYYPSGGPATGPGSSVGGSTGGQVDFGQFFSDLFAGGQVVAIPTPVDGYRSGGGINASALLGLAVVGGLGFLAYRWWRSR